MVRIEAGGRGFFIGAQAAALHIIPLKQIPNFPLGPIHREGIRIWVPFAGWLHLRFYAG